MVLIILLELLETAYTFSHNMFTFSINVFYVYIIPDCYSNS